MFNLIVYYQCKSECFWTEKPTAIVIPLPSVSVVRVENHSETDNILLLRKKMVCRIELRFLGNFEKMHDKVRHCIIITFVYMRRHSNGCTVIAAQTAARIYRFSFGNVIFHVKQPILRTKQWWFADSAPGVPCAEDSSLLTAPAVV